MILKAHILLITCVVYLMPFSAFSKCSKEDVEFYLEKGFTQEQITQLCSASDTAVPDYKPYQQQVVIYGDGEAPGIKDGLTKEERDSVKVLLEGGDVTALHVTPQTISYTGRVCLVSTSSPNVGDRYKDCIEVDYVIQRKGLIVSSSGKKLLVFGSGVVQLEGEIHRTPKRSFDDYPVEVRKALKRNYDWKESGNKTDFPVRGDYSVTRIVNALRTLAATYKETDPAEQIAGVEKKAEKNSEELKNEKKKRWWNPFD